MRSSLPRLVFLLTFISLFSTNSLGNQISIGGATPATQWDVFDVRLKAESLSTSPKDVEIAASFEAESGESFSTSGFYDGDGTFILRFTPPLAGIWHYKTQSSLKELDGIEGDIVVEKPRDG
ncbi:MAG: DUF5060 domain-containing protein, partial [Planctomycetota bacterium]